MVSERQVPGHIAVIMDGNGRWAERRGRPRIFGHVRGCSRVREIIREADRLGIRALTLYAFSSENWGRPRPEVEVLMRLLYKWLKREQAEIMEKNIRFRAIGTLERMPAVIQKAIRETVEISQRNSGLNVTLALSYGGRDEIVHAVRKLCRQAHQGQLNLEEIEELNESAISAEVFSPDLGDPDLLIRTSGEQRISNFLLWQLAYTELYFTDTMWPDFRAADLRRAVDSYSRRQRRYGLTSSQLEMRV